MASKKKQSEGIALLSMYRDDEDDDEMEDVEEEQHHHQDATAGDEPENGLANNTDPMAVIDSGNEAANTPTPQRLVSPHEQHRSVSSIRVTATTTTTTTRIMKRESLTIVDYGHDEVAMSPEPEEGEMIGDQLHVTNGDFMNRTPSGTVQVLTPSHQANNPQFSEPLNSDGMNNDAMKTDDAEIGEANQDEQKPVDPLDKFLPPPPKAKCTEELQKKINKFLEYTKAGKSFNSEVRNKKNYRNPDFLLHAVRYQDIDQIGSCFSKDVFDPHGYDPSDFYDEIEADMRRESDRKEQEKKKAQKVDFIPGGTQPGISASAPRISMPVAVTASGLHSADSINRDGRPNKKSKWDKVDGDRKNPLPSVGPDSASAVGAHAAILSAANAGGGYMLFAQQKRREAEEKRSSERRLERRS